MMRLLTILCTFILLLTGPAAAAEVRISAAASLTEVLKELLGAYQQSNPEIRLLANFAPSGTLAKQIVAGAPADIYISANPKWMDYLVQQNLIATNSQQTLLQNSLVFVGAAQSQIKSLQDLSSLTRIALASPKSAPAGKYAEQALTAAGLYARMASSRQLVFAKDVRQALLYADRGEVDGAFVYQTDALLAREAKILFAVPQQLYPQVEYPAAMTDSGAKQPAVRTFFNYLAGNEAQKTFQSYGFILPR